MIRLCLGTASARPAIDAAPIEGLGQRQGQVHGTRVVDRYGWSSIDQEVELTPRPQAGSAGSFRYDRKLATIASWKLTPLVFFPEPYLVKALGIGGGPRHARRVELHDNVPGMVDGDDPTTVLRQDRLHDSPGRFR